MGKGQTIGSEAYLAQEVAKLYPTEFTPPSSFWGGNGSLVSGGYVQIGKLIIVNMTINKAVANNWYTAVLPKPLVTSSLSANANINGAYTSLPASIETENGILIIPVNGSFDVSVGGVYIAK